MRRRGARAAVVIGVVGLAGVAMLPLQAATAAAKRPTVTIKRTAHGIPHITARSYYGLGYGYGYAFAQDNICTIADSYVTVRAERSRYFGPDESYAFRGNGTVVNNLNSDFFFKRIIDRHIVERLLAQRPPAGPRPEVRAGVRGYVDGYNRYLRRTGVDRIPDPTCRGKAWVKPIQRIDAYRRFYQLALLASSGVAIDGIGGAQPPSGPQPGGVAAARARALRALERIDPRRFDELLGGIGSNAYGLGRAATDNGRGMVLGNPHFPWDGSERFWESHLRIPGKLNVAGASLFGVPLVLIGHTRGLAWSHTVSTARRFTIFEERLVPGDPTSYYVDGKPRRMERTTVSVQARTQGGRLETRRRTLYETNHGQLLTSILGLPVFPWTPGIAFSMGDVNASNFRYLNHFFEVNRAQSVERLHDILRSLQGIPWVNTIAADASGDAYYADIGAVPHVTDEQIRRCSTALGVAADTALRVQVLDGSRSECEWGSDPDAAASGILGPSRMPWLRRDDWVLNSNDSYWLTNPAQPLEGYPRIIGDERTPRSLRTRLGIRIVQQRLAGADGGHGFRFTPRQLQDAVFNDRQFLGELWRDQLVGMCRSHPLVPTSDGAFVDTAEACGVLARWDLHDDLDSRGALLFRRFASHALAAPAGLPLNPLSSAYPWTTPFSASDPVGTPRGLNTASLHVWQALGDAISDLRGAHIPLDAPLGRYQYEMRGNERIPIHGGPGSVGDFNAINVTWNSERGYPNVPHGSSFVMVSHFTGSRRCPVATRTILTYSQSASPASRWFADQTRMFSRKRWVREAFCPREVARAKAVSVTRLRARPRR